MGVFSKFVMFSITIYTCMYHRSRIHVCIIDHLLVCSADVMPVCPLRFNLWMREYRKMPRKFFKKADSCRAQYYLVKVIGHKSWPILRLQWSGGMKKSRLGSITYHTFPVFRYQDSKERDVYQTHLKPGIQTLSRRVLSTGVETQKTSPKLQSGNWVAKMKVLSRAYSV